MTLEISINQESISADSLSNYLYALYDSCNLVERWSLVQVDASERGKRNGFTKFGLSIRSASVRPFTDGVFGLGWNGGSPGLLVAFG